MNRLKRYFITTLGLRGSWTWACRQMDKGEIIHQTTITGACKYRLDFEGNRRIQWAFVPQLPAKADWSNAYIFLADFDRVDYAVWKQRP